MDAGNNETLGALSEHASKKRQGTKSREMYRERYGDLNEVRGLGKLDWIAQAERWHELARAQNSWRRRSPFNSRCIRAQLLRKPNASNALDSQLRKSCHMSCLGT